MRLSVFILILFFQPIAHASSEIEPSESPSLIRDYPSVYNRINKIYEVTLSPFGYGPLPGTMSGLNVGYFMHPLVQFTLNISSLTKSAYSCAGSLSCSASGNSIAAGFKKFAGNSFYWAFGIERREYQFEQAMDSDYSFDFKGNAFSVELFFGNQWQWQNFTLGCDWVGMTLPIYHNIEHENITGGGTESITTLHSREEVALINEGTIGFRFYLGASF